MIPHCPLEKKKSHYKPTQYEKHLKYHCVCHILQNSEWDCGIACVAMVLQGVDVQCTLSDLSMQCALESLWTIDLVFLLHNHFQGHFNYYTSYLGCRKEYQLDKFYQQNFDEDEKRVTKLFAIAKHQSISIVQRVISLDELKNFLHCQGYVAILLVNARLLKCQKCQYYKEKQGSDVSAYKGFDAFPAEKMKDYNYIGHFVCLIGYDPTEDVFYYRDPSVIYSYCTVSAKTLDMARRAKETDHDCIVIQL
ncbi:Guanylyl cyclase [Spinellus fusiger]|nr:Guanylyl cyclase [Spinellus fusiger]